MKSKYHFFMSNDRKFLFSGVNISNGPLCVKENVNTTQHVVKGIRLREAGFNEAPQAGVTIDISKGMQSKKR